MHRIIPWSVIDCHGIRPSTYWGHNGATLDTASYRANGDDSLYASVVPVREVITNAGSLFSEFDSLFFVLFCSQNWAFGDSRNGLLLHDCFFLSSIVNVSSSNVAYFMLHRGKLICIKHRLFVSF